MSEDLFGKPSVVTIDPDKDYFAELVGENAKFKTPQALARGKVESDLHISHLETELNELRQQITKQMTMQDFLDQLETRYKAQTPPVEPGNQSGERQPTADPLHKVLSREEVLDVFRQEQEAQAQARNVATVQQALKDAWGAEAQLRLRQAAFEVGVSEQFLEGMAKTNPQAFLKLVGAIAPAQSGKAVFTPMGTQVNTAGALKNAPVKDYAYYENLRKTNPALYHSAVIQKERWEQAKVLGEKF